MGILTRRLMMQGSAIPRTGTGTLTAGAISTITNDSKLNGFVSGCRMSSGTLLISYMKANNTGAGVNTAIVVGKTSSDDGGTWSGETTLASDATHGCLNNGLLRLTSNRILLEYNLFASGTTPPDAVRTQYSDDNGVTWSTPFLVNSSFTGYCASGTSRPIQLPSGTILLPVYGDNGGTYSSSHVFFSTDNGASFSGEVVMANGTTDSRDYFEPSLVLLPSGTILCQMRTTGGSGNTYQCSSTDNGATWSATTSKFGGYAPSNVYRRYTGTLVATTRGNAAGKVEAFTSIDSGSSWVSQGILDSTSYVVMDYAFGIDKLDGSMLVVYSIENSSTDADVKQVVVTETFA